MGRSKGTAAVVLAAGQSSRLGEAKQAVTVGGETLLDRTVRVATEAGCEPVVVVLGARAKTVADACDLRSVWIVVNAMWEEGMGSSVRAGVDLLKGFPGVTGAVLLTCDMPGVTAEHLRELAAEEEVVTASGYAGRRGVPAYFPQSAFAELMEVEGDAGARELLREARVVELEGGEWDVDTPEQLERVRERFGA